MNLNGNPRLENMEISDNLDFANFFSDIVDNIFEELKPGQRTETGLKLDNVNDSVLFKKVNANLIKRNSLNEPKTTYELP